MLKNKQAVSNRERFSLGLKNLCFIKVIKGKLVAIYDAIDFHEKNAMDKLATAIFTLDISENYQSSFLASVEGVTTGSARAVSLHDSIRLGDLDCY
jgi:hypothetical protein